MRGVVLLIVWLLAGTVRADAIDELATTLATHRNEKARVAAAAALYKQGGKRALRPLVDALDDKSASVRLVAVASLGQLAHKAALPALQRRAAGDLDAKVRDAAKKAATKIRVTHGLGDIPAPAPVALAKPSAVPPRRMGPDNVWVAVGSVTDDSRLPIPTKKSHVAYTRTVLLSELRAAKVTTTRPAPAVAAANGQIERQIDVSVVKIEHRVRGTQVEVEAEVRVAISDETGSMLAILTRGAMVQYPKASMGQKNLMLWRREALDAAVKNAVKLMLTQLSRGVEG